MDPEEDFNRFRYRTRVQAVAVIDILVGTIPFIRLAFDFNKKDLIDAFPDREVLVLFWSILFCVYVLQLIMGIWLLAATREVYSEYTVGNCQVWFYVAAFSFIFYTGEMVYDIHGIYHTPPANRSAKQVFFTMIFHAAKIIYRAVTLMIVNNFLFDICRPIQGFLTQGSYQYKHYYQTKSGVESVPPLQQPARVPPPIPPPPQQQQQQLQLQQQLQPLQPQPIIQPLPPPQPIIPQAYPVQAQPTYSYFSTYPQPHNRVVVANHHQQYFTQPRPMRPRRALPQPPYQYRPLPAQVNLNGGTSNYLYHDGMAVRPR